MDAMDRVAEQVERTRQAREASQHVLSESARARQERRDARHLAQNP